MVVYGGKVICDTGNVLQFKHPHVDIVSMDTVQWVLHIEGGWMHSGYSICGHDWGTIMFVYLIIGVSPLRGSTASVCVSVVHVCIHLLLV